MKEGAEKRFADVKAYEIAYAVFRVAAQVPNEAVKESFERRALGVLDATVSAKYAPAIAEIRSLEYLLRFGSDVGFVHSESVEKIVEELGVLYETIEASLSVLKAEPTNLEGIFSKTRPVNGAHVDARQEGISGDAAEEPRGSMSGIIKSGLRQSAILDRIRQSGNCKLKDIQEILPECSERTIRYDLQSLLEQKLIERVGNGGPAVFYRMRQNA